MSFLSGGYTLLMEGPGVEEWNFNSTAKHCQPAGDNFGVSYPFSIKKWWSLYTNLNAIPSSH
jgi:hypothetical protein